MPSDSPSGESTTSIDPGWVYLLHFEHRVGGHAQHYLGWSPNPRDRLQAHMDGRGSKLVYEASLWGEVTIARLWRGGKTLERQLKNRKEGPRLCPICNPPAGRS